MYNVYFCHIEYGRNEIWNGICTFAWTIITSTLGCCPYILRSQIGCIRNFVHFKQLFVFVALMASFMNCNFQKDLNKIGNSSKINIFNEIIRLVQKTGYPVVRIQCHISNVVYLNLENKNSRFIIIKWLWDYLFMSHFIRISTKLSYAQAFRFTENEEDEIKKKQLRKSNPIEWEKRNDRLFVNVASSKVP